MTRFNQLDLQYYRLMAATPIHLYRILILYYSSICSRSFTDYKALCTNRKLQIFDKWERKSTFSGSTATTASCRCHWNTLSTRRQMNEMKWRRRRRIEKHKTCAHTWDLGHGFANRKYGTVNKLTLKCRTFKNLLWLRFFVVGIFFYLDISNIFQRVVNWTHSHSHTGQVEL